MGSWGTVLPGWRAGFARGHPRSTNSFVVFTCCCHLWVPLAMSLCPPADELLRKEVAVLLPSCPPKHPLSALRVQLTRCFWWSLYVCEVITLVNIVLCAFKILDGWQCICAEIKWQLQKFSDIKVYVLCTGSHLPQAGRLYIVAFYVRCIKWQEVLWRLSVVGFKSAMKHGRSFPWGNHTHHVWFVCHPHTCHPQEEATE